jgi:hypothetical protein
MSKKKSPRPASDRPSEGATNLSTHNVPTDSSALVQLKPAEESFYAPAFSAEELAYLEARAEADDLDDAIALLKVMILRALGKRVELGNSRADNHLATGDLISPGASGSPADAETIRRYVDTLCRAIRIKHSLGSKQSAALQAAIDQVLDELTGDWERDSKEEQKSPRPHA